jgi:pyruvate/2-oxoglutarate dehydrogenase complex dihydrolipoamide dehydrogenase (E3) component
LGVDAERIIMEHRRLPGPSPGSEGGEIMTMTQIAMLGKLTYTAMADAIFTHPLLAEGLNTLFAMVDA